MRKKRKLPRWLIAILKSLRIVGKGYDEDFGEDMKFGVKGKVEF